jgi:xylan 1,4-beta-xylosidase
MNNNSEVQITIDTGKSGGPLRHTWNYIGYDECNYSTFPLGRQLLADFGALPDAPYYVRAHHMLCTGNGGSNTLKWGSTNVYREDENGKPVYRWDMLDGILDAIINSGNIPFFELGFTPYDLVPAGEFKGYAGIDIYRHYAAAAHTLPPKDYGKWAGLVSAVAAHCAERYGLDAVRGWYWELWNEPDIRHYWGGTREEYIKLYDYTEAALHAVLPDARLGGPATTGPEPGKDSLAFLESFLEHCRSGKNYLTGKTGTRLDYITFHAKGGGYCFDQKKSGCTISVKHLTDNVRCGLGAVKKYGYASLEVVLSEADPDGWAAGGMYDNPNFNFRNTEYYASYIACAYYHIAKLAKEENMDVRPLAWAFMFPSERCFEGTRSFATQGIKKASFNAFRLMSALRGNELEVKLENSRDITAEKNAAEVFAAAAEDGKCDRILIASHNDDWDAAGFNKVRLRILGLSPSGRVSVRRLLVDAGHGSAYAKWLELGRPEYPEGSVYDAIRRSDAPETIDEKTAQTGADGGLTLDFTLAAHALTLIEIGK